MANQRNGFREQLRAFVQTHPSGWNHHDWLALLAELTDAGVDTSDPDRIGAELEHERILAVLESVDLKGLGPKRRQALADHARTLDRMVDVIMARTFAHQSVLTLAEYAEVPVINGLSDYTHPCQVLADFQTITEKKGELKGLTLAYVGDGNNMAHSLMFIGAKTGVSVRIVCPKGYEPRAEVLALASEDAKETGASITVTNDLSEGVSGADVVCTDVWASMGMEAEAEARKAIFRPYQVNAALMAKAKEDAIFMHCLPAHRDDEVTDEVIESWQSVVFDEAENRLHAQKAVILRLMVAEGELD